MCVLLAERKGYNSKSESIVTVRKSCHNNDFGMTSIQTRVDPLWFHSLHQWYHIKVVQDPANSLEDARIGLICNEYNVNRTIIAELNVKLHFFFSVSITDDFMAGIIVDGVHPEQKT